MARAKKKLTRPDLIAALAPASAHLLAAAVELVAAARAAVDALTEDSAGLPAKSVDALRSARASLDLLASLATTGADASRSRVRDAARREALGEILSALDARASKMSGPAAEAFAAVREAVASSGARGSTRPEAARRERPRSPAPSPATATRGRTTETKASNLRRIPIVLDPDRDEE